MKARIAVSLVTLAAVGVLVGAAARDTRIEPAFCGEFTPARLLEDPQIAHQLHRALDRGDREAEAHFQAMVAEMRAVHGCGRLEGAAASLPEGTLAPRLPPGHPPVGRGTPLPLFSDEPRVISL